MPGISGKLLLFVKVRKLQREVMCIMQKFFKVFGVVMEAIAIVLFVALLCDVVRGVVIMSDSLWFDLVITYLLVGLLFGIGIFKLSRSAFEVKSTHPNVGPYVYRLKPQEETGRFIPLLAQALWPLVPGYSSLVIPLHMLTWPVSVVLRLGIVYFVVAVGVFVWLVVKASLCMAKFFDSSVDCDVEKL